MDKTKKTVLYGLMIAFVCIATIVIQIPIPGTEGYVNIGDCVIFITSIIFGPIPGMLAGGIGSALADLFSGYTYWVVFSLIIKGLEGLVVGLIYWRMKNRLVMFISMIIGAIIMVIGYFIGGYILKGNFIVALGSIPPNIVQGVIGIVIAMFFSGYIQKIYKKNYTKNK